MSRRTCGYRHAITNLCTGKRVTSSIADCGPQTDLFCGQRGCCGGTCATNRLVDLTPAAFTAIGGNLDAGLLPANINVG
ncbi:hypothetical protein [Kribbella sp. NPDC004875]|jgi:hypothetical protein|uniref:hypothetical protein n=1 Tax=Kribbella sp. NPDC004875 TaxID=3364107 RepID=UPI0036BB5A25